MKLPYERFLRFLVSRKIDVNQTCESLDLPRAGDLWIADARSSLRRTAPFALVRYIDSTDEPLLTDGVLDWAEQEKILPLWKMQPEFGEVQSIELDLAYKIFLDPAARALAGLCLMSQARDPETCEVLRDKTGIFPSVEALGVYKAIFWDVAQMGREDWERLVKILRSHDERMCIAFGLGNPSITDIRDWLDMDLPVQDHKMIINQIIAKSYMQFKQAMSAPMIDSAEALRWAELVLKGIGVAKANNLLDGDKGATGPLIGNVDRFRTLFSVTPSKSNHPTLAELVGETTSREVKALIK